LKLTIAQIAKLANVSKATVSRALNGSGYVSEETRKKILEIVKKYDYVPDSKAVSLSKKKTNTIGIILPSVSGPFYGEVLKGAEEVLIHEGYFTLLVVLDSNNNIKKARERYLKVIREKRVDGAIIFDPMLDQKTAIRIVEYGVPVIFLVKVFKEADSVTIDNFSASVAMMEHLIKDHGYKNIAFVRGPETSIDSEERYKGYMFSVQKYGLETYVFNSDLTYEGGRKVFEKIKPFLKNLDAIFCANDEMALGIVKELKNEGIHPGEDIAVVGFDDAVWTPHIEPPLTTVHQPMYEYGKVAASRLLDRIRYPDTFQKPLTIKLNWEIVIRKSCGC
jgi:LacI family transcriptional regulator